MKVLSASGYYNLATPYRAVKHTVTGLGFDPILCKNITIKRCDAGHMMYVHGPSLHKLNRNGAVLIDGTREK
jgi:carboxypeptidase C (cathepsin A)